MFFDIAPKGARRETLGAGGLSRIGNPSRPPARTNLVLGTGEAGLKFRLLGFGGLKNTHMFAYVRINSHMFA